LWVSLNTCLFQTKKNFLCDRGKIIHSVTWSLDVTFPAPFRQMLSALSIFSLDFIALECVSDSVNPFTSVYLWSAAPVVLAMLIALHHLVNCRLRGNLQRSSNNITTITNNNNNNLTYRLLLLGYLVLPTVTEKQLQALDCVEIAEKKYLRVDTAIDCNSESFRAFRIADSFLVTAYLGAPLVWHKEMS
jgi:hypothetical protein